MSDEAHGVASSRAAATIADVARLAGVGKGTVSRVLNGGAVSAATRALVEQAIADLDFVPSYVGQSLARGRVSAIAVVVPFVTHPSSVVRVQGVIEGLRPCGLPVTILDVETPEHARAHLRSLVGRMRPEGAIVVSLPPDDELVAALRAGGPPTVWVDGAIEGFPSVYVDDAGGGRLAASHLIELGHRHIAFIGDNDEGFGFTSSSNRHRGYLAALAEHGFEPAAEAFGPHGREMAAELAVQMLTGDTPPTAIVAASDTQAAGVLAAAARLGRRVPADLSVVGFDDVEIASMLGLTTIRQPIADSGRRAAHMLLSAMTGAGGDPHDELPVELIIRQSTGAVGTAPVP